MRPALASTSLEIALTTTVLVATHWYRSPQYDVSRARSLFTPNFCNPHCRFFGTFHCFQMIIRSLVLKCASISVIAFFHRAESVIVYPPSCHLVDFRNLTCDCSWHLPASQFLQLTLKLCY